MVANNKEETKTREFKIGHCKHGDNRYSLNIEVEDVQVQLRTFCWDNHAGYVASIAIFDLSKEDMYALADAIKLEAGKLTDEG